MATEDIIREELVTLRFDIINASKLKRQQASGSTYNAIELVDVGAFSGSLVGPAHIATLATGRRAGKVPYDFVERLKTWAKAKGISFKSDDDLERWAKAVMWKIKREGTALWRTTGSKSSQLDIFKTPIDMCIERLTSRLSMFLYTDTKSRINKTIDEINSK